MRLKYWFPNGVPAVADEDMSEWMDYLYMQNATLLNNPPTPKRSHSEAKRG